MMRWARRRLATRFSLGIGVLLVCLLAVAGTAAVTLNSVVASVDAAVEEAERETLPLSQLEVRVIAAERLAHDAVLSPDAAGEPQLSSYWEEAAAVERSLSELVATVPFSEEGDLVRAARDDWGLAQAALRRVEPELTSDAAFHTSGYEAAMLDVRRALDLAGDVSSGDLAAEAQEARDDRRTLLTVVGLVCAAALVAAALDGRALARSVLVPLRTLSDGARRLASGDLSHRVALGRSDELGEVGEALDALADELERGTEELVRRSLHDGLTGLANRTLLMDRTCHALRGLRRSPSALTLLVLDLHGFTTVNDSLGVAAGDTLLVRVAERLRLCTRASDTVARIGGDEFAVLIEDAATPLEALGTAERLLANLRLPVRVDGRELFLDACIGVGMASSPDDRAEDLLGNADLALYRAKQQGPGRCELFEAGLHTEAVERLGLEADLRRALESGQLAVHYQPTIDLATGTVQGVEALVRWKHPQRGMVPPSEFIPLAEETGLVVPLGWWVLDAACAEAGRWLGRGPLAPFTLSVNLSSRQLTHPELPGRVGAALASSGLDPSCLVLEITETVMMRDDHVTHGRLRELKALGVSLAVDDFGTGYSSLAYLQQFPIDVLKIDKSFVDEIDETGRGGAVAAAIVHLAEALQLRTVAEGVEREAQAVALRTFGCSMAQGFHFSRALPGPEVRELLAAERAALVVGA